jgi:hypothetical protein
MKALTLRQPWAEAICRGWKRIETRSWAPGAEWSGRRMALFGDLPPMPFPIAIHSSKAMSVAERAFGAANSIVEPPLGMVVATAKVACCVRMTAEGIETICEGERLWGNYAPGRWAWYLADVKRLATPVPAKGRLGLWEWRAA